MEVITIETKAFYRLLHDLENLTKALNHENSELNRTNKKLQNVALRDQWIDTEEVCFILKSTKRTVQNYRDKFILPYVQVGRKILYKLSDVKKLLENNYINIDSP